MSNSRSVCCENSVDKKVVKINLVIIRTIQTQNYLKKISAYFNEFLNNLFLSVTHKVLPLHLSKTIVIVPFMVQSCIDNIRV